MLTLAKQQSNAPKACQTYDGVDDAADNRALSTEQPGHQVKLEDADKAPVDRTDDGEDQCDSIHTCNLHCIYCAYIESPDFGEIYTKLKI